MTLFSLSDSCISKSVALVLHKTSLIKLWFGVIFLTLYWVHIRNSPVQFKAAFNRRYDWDVCSIGLQCPLQKELGKVCLFLSYRHYESSTYPILSSNFLEVRVKSPNFLCSILISRTIYTSLQVTSLQQVLLCYFAGYLVLYEPS